MQVKVKYTSNEIEGEWISQKEQQSLLQSRAKILTKITRLLKRTVMLNKLVVLMVSGWTSTGCEDLFLCTLFSCSSFPLDEEEQYLRSTRTLLLVPFDSSVSYLDSDEQVKQSCMRLETLRPSLLFLESHLKGDAQQCICSMVRLAWFVMEN